MQKLSFTFLLVLGLCAAYAQDSKIMVGASGRVFGPACTNCTALTGFGLSGGYTVINKVVATLDVGFYGKSEGSSKINSTAVGISGDFYPKEAFRGFYIGPDISYITITQKISDTEVFSDNSISIGLNLGWAIPIGERLRIIPHMGYGTWYENSKGRITFGAKVGFKI